jgi:hypothetical protein
LLAKRLFSEDVMNESFRTTIPDSETVSQSGVAWAAIAAGAVAAAALTLVLVAFGAGLGLSAISPWSNSGVSVTTFKIGTRIVGLHSNEVFFRDTAHGFLAWAFATLISATALASTTSYLANGAVTGLTGMSSTGMSSQSSAADPFQLYVDKLFRAPASAQAGASSPRNPDVPAEVARLWKADFASSAELAPGDRAYVAQLVAAQTGMSPADAQKRVDEVVAEAKSDADNARRAAAHLSFWVTAALLFGAFAASLAAAEGGVFRDGTWDGRVLTPREI